MADWVPFFTHDGSVGLYSKEDKDVYHSVFGAASEAYEKFILPANFKDYFKKKKEIKILDLCYGIGYNTKSFLNYFFQNFDFLKESIYSIDTDNILKQKYIEKRDTYNISNSKTNYSIYTNNIFSENFLKSSISKIKNYKIQIDAVDTNELLMKLSPLFINSNKKNKPSVTGIADIDKYLNIYDKNTTNHFHKFMPEVNMIILHNLFKTFNNNYLSEDVWNILNDKNYVKFLDCDMRRYMAFCFSKVYNLSSEFVKSTFLHNIYYEYISKSYKNTLKVLENNEISIRYISDDARKFLLSNDNCYDFVFLDAFSPNKCPNLWTYEFFNLLFKNLSEDGKILTYSNSASIRNAMLKNNFYIAKIYNECENKFTGTIAVKNKNLIKQNMDEYDFGLLNTNAGIMYRDENLSADNESILSARNNAVENSNLISTTQYKNKYKGVLNGI